MTKTSKAAHAISDTLATAKPRLSPDAHFDTIACQARRDGLAMTIAELEGACDRAFVVDAPIQCILDIIGAETSNNLIATCSFDADGRIDVIPLRSYCQQGPKDGRLIIVDNSWVGPWLCRPLGMGADIVVEDLGSWLGIKATVVVARSSALQKRLAALLGEYIGNHAIKEKTEQEIMSVLPSVSLRMQRRCDNALVVAHYLAVHPRVKWVSYPGLAQDGSNDAAHRTLDHGFGPTISFMPLDENLVSLMGIQQVPSNPGVSVLPCDISRMWSVGTSGVLALTVGLESALDIIEDLESMLAPEASSIERRECILI